MVGMGLGACPFCGLRIPSGSATCPQCGSLPDAERGTMARSLVAVLCFAMLGAAMVWLALELSR